MCSFWALVFVYRDGYANDTMLAYGYVQSIGVVYTSAECVADCFR